jgi:phage baseplate assembly protein W
MATTTTHNSYGADVSLSVKRNTSSKYKRRAGFVYPLTGSFKTVTGTPAALQNNASEGSYFSPAYGVSLIRNNLRQLLLCEKGERVMLPNYGLSLQKYVFEPLDETTYFLVKNDILQTINTYFSIVNVISLSVFSTAIEANRNQLVVRLTLQLLDSSLDIFDVEVNLA